MFLKVSSPFWRGKKPSIFNLDIYKELDISKNAWKIKHYIYMLLIIVTSRLSTQLEPWRSVRT
jgi:hypothetical protein